MEVWEVKPMRKAGLLGNSLQGPCNCDKMTVYTWVGGPK